MRLYHCVTALICLLDLVAAIVWAQSRLSEEDVVSALQGKPPAVAPGQLVGMALHVTFPPQTSASVEGAWAPSGGSSRADEAFYKTLIPLARALEAEVVRGSRFVVRVRPSLQLPFELADRLGRQLADTVEHFLITHFAIPRERLSWQMSLPNSTAAGLGVPPLGPQRWRLEVLQQE
jgi:hypothetical protein